MIKKLIIVLFTLGICMSAQAGEYVLDVRSLPEVNQTGKKLKVLSSMTTTLLIFTEV